MGQNGIAIPVHDVTLSAFAMADTEVTNAQFAAVYNWAYGAGKFDEPGELDATTVRESGIDLFELDADYSDISWNGSSFIVASGREQYPVVGITWHGAMAFCLYLNEMENREAAVSVESSGSVINWTIDLSKGYRLPTEAEWEYAARGGLAGRNFPNGDVLTGLDANYWNSGDMWEPGAAPVGQFPANGYGLFDMAGNVWEYNADYSGFYP